MMVFFLGVVVAIAIVILWALYLSARKPTPKQEPQIHCTTLGGTSVPDIDKARVNQILREL
jgi:hypothetical protein